MKHKITIGYVNGTEETYYVDDFQEQPDRVILCGVRWRDKPLAEMGMIPNSAILSMWVSEVRS